MSEKELENFTASAIKYGKAENPRHIAHGKGALAKQIEATAREHNIPVLQDFALSKRLSTIPVGDDIPETLFVTIAMLLGHILEFEGEYDEEKPS